MLGIGVQTKNIIDELHPEEGFAILKEAGFSNVDFSLNGFLLNTDIYENRRNVFFDQSEQELKSYFSLFKETAKKYNITINQMHMPYPVFVPSKPKELNDYLWDKVAYKSMKIAEYLECPNIVIHGFKLARFLGSEELEWKETERLIDYLAPMAIESKTVICIENLYDNIGGHLIEGPCCNVDKAVGRIDKINEKYGQEVLGFCFDTGHANLIGLDFEDFLTMLGGRLKVLHVHDNDGILDLHQIPFTFSKSRENKASTDWEGFVKGLRNIHFDGVLSFETAPVLTAFPEGLKKEALSFIASIGNYFIKEIEKE